MIHVYVEVVKSTKSVVDKSIIIKRDVINYVPFFMDNKLLIVSKI